MTPKDLTFSVIIPVRDQAVLLEKLLISLSENAPRDKGIEIIVVDDASQEPLEPICARYGARYARNEVSQGPAVSRNLGAEMSTGAVLVFLDADVECPKGFFEKIQQVLEEQPEVHAISFLSAPFKPCDGYMKNFGAILEYHWFSKYFDATDDVAPVQGVTTRNCAVRKTAYETIGGFDSRFKTNAIEDYDFGKRLAERFSCVLVREPCLYHNFPSSFWRVMRNYFVRAALWVPYFLRHSPPLDREQVSTKEARLRLVACGVLVAGIAACASTPFRWFFVSAAMVLFLFYLWGIRRFLRLAWSHTHDILFGVFCVGVHFLSTFVIVAGATWGLTMYMLSALRIIRNV